MVKNDIVDKIIAFEEGLLSEQETIDFFQEMIDDGMVWRLQGSYGSMAQALIDAGLCQSK